MKIFHFCNLYPDKLGSFERWLVNIGVAIREGGDVSIICVAGKPIGQIADMLQKVCVRWYVNEKWSDGKGNEHPWQFCLPALKLISCERPDLVVVSFGNEFPCMVVRIISWLMGMHRCRWVWVQHQQIRDPSWFTHRFSRIRMLSWFFDHITTVYEGGRQSILLRGVSAEKVSTIYNGSDEPNTVKIRGWLRNEIGVSMDSVVIACTSWLIERKRIDFLIRSFSELLKSCSAGNTDAMKRSLPVLIIIGDGPLRKQLEELAVELQVGGNVYFLGVRNDINDVLKDVDIFALSSKAEACANAILEAMALSLPVVATDAGASREQVIDGVSGYVVGLDDFNGFVSALKKLEADAPLRREMGVKARRRWEQGFSSIKSARNHYALWCKLIGSE